MKRKQTAFFADHLSQIFHFASTYEIPSIHRVSSSPQMQLAAMSKVVHCTYGRAVIPKFSADGLLSLLFL